VPGAGGRAPGRVGNKKPTQKKPLKMFLFFYFFKYLIFSENNTKFCL
jgi:hypothetical protein